MVHNQINRPGVSVIVAKGIRISNVYLKIQFIGVAFKDPSVCNPVMGLKLCNKNRVLKKAELGKKGVCLIQSYVFRALRPIELCNKGLEICKGV